LLGVAAHTIDTASALGPGILPLAKSSVISIKTANRESTLRVIAALLLGLAYAIFQIRQSLDQGQLAFPATYDDTTYFREGLQSLHAVYDRGVGAFFTQWWSAPPHSPWSKMVAFTGFALFGAHAWAPASVETLSLLAVLAAVAVWTRNLPRAAAALIIVGLLTWPYLGHLVVDTRPDMAWGIGTAVFCAIVASTATEALSPAKTASAAALLALALLAKPSTFPVTVAIAVVVAAAALVARRRIDPTGTGALARRLLIVGAAALVLVLPHYVVAGREIVRYIVVNVFGSQAHIWELPLGFAGHALYHVTGPGAKAMLRPWLWLFLVTFCVFTFSVARRRDRGAVLRAGCYAVALVVAFLAVTVPAHKSPYIGAVFPAMLGVAWVVMCGYIVQTWTRGQARSLAYGLLAVLVVVGVLGFEWHSTIRFGPVRPERFVEIRKRHADIASVFDALDRANLSSGRVFVDASSPYLNAETLRYYALAQRRDDLYFVDDIFSNDAARAATHVSQSDAVLAFAPDNADVLSYLPSGAPAHLGAVIALAEADDQLRPIAIETSSGKPGSIRLFVRHGPLEIGRDAQGIGPLEGPYPQWSLPVVRWGYGPASRFFVPASARPSRLVLEAQTPHRGEVLSVKIDGVERLRHEFRTVDVPEAFAVVLPATAREGWDVELDYSQWSPGTAADPRKVAVLFRKIQAVPDRAGDARPRP
jgi:hypothetical protein